MSGNLSRLRVYCAGSVNSTVIKFVYFLFSIFSLTVGFLIYYLFRNNNILIYEWFHFLPKNNNIIIFSNKSFLLDFFRYNLPDGLLLLSGLLFLRAIWLGKNSTSKKYIRIFCVISMLYELLQWLEFMPGTFDVRDLIVMVLIAFVEGVFYNCFLRRRICHEN
jgi:hypothetical protein